LRGVEALALELQGQALAPQDVDERRALVAQRCAASARVSGGIDEQVGAVLRVRHYAMLACHPRGGNRIR